MNKINQSVEELEELFFKKEKAEFNDYSTDEIETKITNIQNQLIVKIIDVLQDIVPRRLPPLEIDNPRPSIEDEVSSSFEELIEKIGLEDEEDESLLIELDGAKKEHHELIIYLSSWYTFSGQPDQAVGYLKEIIEFDPDPVVYYNLSYVFAVQNVLPPALEYIDMIADAFDPELVELNKAVIYDRLGRYAEARNHFQNAVEAADETSKYLYNWALSAKGFGKTDESKMILHQLEELDPEYSGLSYQLGEVYAQQGNYTRAIEYFQRAHNRNSDNLTYLADLATACLMGERYLDAIDYYQSYLKQDTSISILNNLGAAYLKTNQFEKAAEILEQAVELDPSHKQSRKNRDLAQSYLD